MDYKKLHKDTINRLQQMVNSGKITVETACGICADFIPESEDERIRKEIKDFFSRIMLGQENFLREDYDWNAWIAWIEKQYKKDEEIILLKDKIESLESARIAMQECHRLELEKLEKQGVQKPAEWSEEDERIVTELIGIFESAVDGGHVTFPYRLVKDYIRVLKLCLPQSAWKPSDEQLDNLSRAFNGATYNNSLLMELYIDLKKLMEE